MLVRLQRQRSERGENNQHGDGFSLPEKKRAGRSARP